MTITIPDDILIIMVVVFVIFCILDNHYSSHG